MVLREVRDDADKKSDKEPMSVDDFPWHEMRKEHALWINAKLSQRNPPYGLATLRRLITAVRRVFYTSWDLGYIDSDTRDRCMQFPKVRGDVPPIGREIEKADIDALFSLCKTDTNLSARSTAALALLFNGGLRRTEVVSVNVESLDFDRRTVKVMGKGAKYRVVPLGAGIEKIKPWLAVRGTSPGPLICQIGRWNHIRQDRRLSASQIYMVLKELAEQVEIAFRPHDARRTLLTGLLRKKMDVLVVAKIAGHKSTSTTAKYDMRGETEMIALYDAVMDEAAEEK